MNLNLFYKKAVPVIALLASTFSEAQEWTYMKGTSLSNQYGVYGTQGVAAPGNMPGSRVAAVSWKDVNGNLWMFGGGGYGASVSSVVGLSDLWKYDLTLNQWAWIAGPTGADQPGIYGTLGVPASANVPGGRQLSVSWTDNSGNLWLYGGYGAAASSGGVLSDLWKFDTALNQWTWVNGPNTSAQAAAYGTQGVGSVTNTPGARSNAVTWKDNNGDFWFFGGTASTNSYNDMWKYSPATNQWTWLSGTNLANQPGAYGIQGTPSSANYPGARVLSTTWTDNNGDLWLFGGSGYGGNTTAGMLNDLWKYTVSSNEWTWVKGPNTVNSAATYGSIGTTSVSNIPGARWEAVGGKDNNGNLLLFGGEGYITTAVGRLNDVWKYDIATNQWTWLKGSNTTNQYGSYGTMGISSAANTPGSRWGLVSWTDNSSNLWIFGGYGNHTNFLGYLNDLWRFDPCTVLPPDPLNTTPSANQNICIGNSTTLTATSTTFTVNWFASATATSALSSGTNFITTVMPVGTYTFYAEGLGCQPSINRTSVAFTVNAQPVITVNSGTLCSGKTFTLMPAGASTYTFSSGSNMVSPLVTSTYSVTGKNSAGCLSSNTAIATVTVFSLPVISANSGSICLGQSFTIVPAGALTYTYSGNFPTVSPLVTTSYSVSGTDINGCVSQAPAVVNVSVSPLPTLSGSSSASVVCAGEQVVLLAMGADTYSWSTGGSGNSITVNPTVTSTYTVTGSGTNGCHATYSLMQAVNQCSGLSTVAGSNPEVSLYPNPGTGEFYMELPQDVKVDVYSLSGQLVHSANYAAGKQLLELNRQENGIYFVRLKFENETRIMKIVKN